MKQWEDMFRRWLSKVIEYFLEKHDKRIRSFDGGMW